eukprot:15142297-Ditylum_brightwellii.AAC.1
MYDGDETDSDLKPWDNHFLPKDIAKMAKFLNKGAVNDGILLNDKETLPGMLNDTIMAHEYFHSKRS